MFGDCFSARPPFLSRSSESAHACSLADEMPCDGLRPRWAPRAPVPAPQAPPYPLPPRTSLSKDLTLLSQ